MKKLLSLACCGFCTACATDLPFSQGSVSEANLNEFFLPRVEVRNATLESSLVQIEGAYAEIARKSGDDDPPLKIQLKDKPDHKVNGNFEDLSALGAIRFLAAQAGLMPKVRRGKVVLTRIPGEKKPSPKSYRVSPNFLENLERTTQRKVPRKSGSPELAVFFREQGLLISPTAEVHHDPSTSTLRIDSSLHDQLRVSTFLRSMSRRSLHTLKLEITRATFERDPEVPDEVLSPAEADKWLHKARKELGAAVQILPTVIARARQTSRIEMVREWSTSLQSSWLGTRARFHLSLYGSTNETRMTYERRLLWHQGKAIPMVVGEDLSGGSASRQSDAINRALEETITPGTIPFRNQTCKVGQRIPNGQVLVQRCTGSSKQIEYLLITVTRIVATGR
jgi:hypothetical protein